MKAEENSTRVLHGDALGPRGRNALADPGAACARAGDACAQAPGDRGRSSAGTGGNRLSDPGTPCRCPPETDAGGKGLGSEGGYLSGVATPLYLRRRALWGDILASEPKEDDLKGSQ